MASSEVEQAGVRLSPTAPATSGRPRVVVSPRSGRLLLSRFRQKATLCYVRARRVKTCSRRYGDLSARSLPSPFGSSAALGATRAVAVAEIERESGLSAEGDDGGVVDLKKSRARAATNPGYVGLRRDAAT